MLGVLLFLSALGGASVLVAAGYLLGVRNGQGAREQLREQSVAQAEELAELRAHLSDEEGEESLRSMIGRMLSPLVEQERLTFALSHLDQHPGRRGDLAFLLDQIAERGNFAAVVLGDEEGWPLAASTNSQNVDRLSATASSLLLLADRMGREGFAAPLSLTIHDSASRVTLCRLFHVRGQRLTLTAVSTNGSLAPTALDPALVQVDAALHRGRPSLSEGEVTERPRG